MPPADVVSEARYRCERIARDLGVPWDSVVAYVASLGGMEQFIDDLGSSMAFQEIVLNFCRGYLLDHLPPGQRDAVGFMAQRRNTFDRREFVDAVTPVMRAYNVQLSDWDGVIKGALHVPGLQHLRHYRGTLDQAVQDLTVYLKGRVSDMASKKKTPQEMMSHNIKRREALNPFCQPRLKELGIDGDPIQCDQFYARAFGMSWVRAIDSETSVEDLQSMFEAHFQQAKASANLSDYLSGRERPPVGGQSPFDFGDTAAKLEQLPVTTPAAATTKESAIKVDDPPVEPPASPVDKTPSAGSAIPDIANEPASDPVDAKAAAQTELETKPLSGRFSQVAFGDISYSCVLDEIDAGHSYAADIAVDDLVAIGEDGKRAVEQHVRKSRNLAADMAVVFKWSETNPSTERIQALRDRCAELARVTYKDLSAHDQALKIQAAWGGLTAKDALCAWGADGAYDKVHELFAKLEIEIEAPPEEKPETALTVPPEINLATQPQPSNVLQFGFRLPSQQECAFIDWIANSVVKSGFYPAIKTIDQARMVMMKGYSLGVDPMSSLDGIEPITDKNGRVTMSFRSKLLKALVERTGQCIRFDVVGDEKKATATVQRKGREVHTFTYTIEEAKVARLADKFTWQSYPKKMLMWRAISQAVDVDFPEVRYVFSVNAPDEEEAA